MQSSCQHRCTPFFWTPFGRIARQKSKPSVAVLLCAARTPTTPVNANCGESRGGRGRFAKRRTTGARRNGHDCLNVATVRSAALGRAVTLASRNRTLRRMGRAKRNPSPSRAAIDGYRCAPPILQIGHAPNAQIQMVRSISASKRISGSIRTSRDVRFAFERFPSKIRMRQ
jgi:hypothetical protein